MLLSWRLKHFLEGTTSLVVVNSCYNMNIFLRILFPYLPLTHDKNPVSGGERYDQIPEREFLLSECSFFWAVFTESHLLSIPNKIVFFILPPPPLATICYQTTFNKKSNAFTTKDDDLTKNFSSMATL